MPVGHAESGSDPQQGCETTVIGMGSGVLPTVVSSTKGYVKTRIHGSILVLYEF